MTYKNPKHAWEVPRSDKRERCGECFVPFAPDEARLPIKGRGGMLRRFPKVCRRCYDKLSTYA